MSVSFAIAIYFVIWWTVLFAVLPIGVRTQGEDGAVVPGTPESAPTRPRLVRVVLLDHAGVGAGVRAACGRPSATMLIDLEQSGSVAAACAEPETKRARPSALLENCRHPVLTLPLALIAAARRAEFLPQTWAAGPLHNDAVFVTVLMAHTLAKPRPSVTPGTKAKFCRQIFPSCRPDRGRARRRDAAVRIASPAGTGY